MATNLFSDEASLGAMSGWPGRFGSAHVRKMASNRSQAAGSSRAASSTTSKRYPSPRASSSLPMSSNPFGVTANFAGSEITSVRLEVADSDS